MQCYTTLRVERITYKFLTVVLLRPLQFLPMMPLPGRGICPPPLCWQVTNDSGYAIERVTKMDIKKVLHYVDWWGGDVRTLVPDLT